MPGDKSISHRAILFSSLAKGNTEIDGFMMGEDCLCTIDCFRKMQVSIEILPTTKLGFWAMDFTVLTRGTPLNAGRSGTAIRLLLGVILSTLLLSNNKERFGS